MKLQRSAKYVSGQTENVFFTTTRQTSPHDLPFLLSSDQFAVIEPVSVWWKQRYNKQQNQRRLVDVQVERQWTHEGHVIFEQSKTLFCGT